MATMSNTNEELFAVGTAGDDASWVSYWSELTLGTYYGKSQISPDADPLVAGARFQFLPGTLVFTFAAGGGVEDTMLQALLSSGAGGNRFGLYVQVHDGDPGDSGGNNVISGIARKYIVDWSVAAS